MRGWTTYKTYTSAKKWHYTVEVWEQPFWNWLQATAYGWYEMRIYKVPGFRRLERFLGQRDKGDPFLYVPLSARQSIRHFRLDRKNKTILARFPVDDDSAIVKAKWKE